MKERGMIFNGEMVRAILNGSKTQTRRIVKLQPDEDGLSKEIAGPWVDSSERTYRCPFGVVGDRIWVRETFSLLGNEDACPVDWDDNIVDDKKDAARIYKASCWQKPNNYGFWSVPEREIEFEGSWTPSIHMPRWASRITLEITGVRVERLCDISEEDALAEGIEPLPHSSGMPQQYHEYFPLGNKNGLRCNSSAAASFAGLWQSIYGEENWQASPWVWVIEFKRVEATDEQ